MRLQVAAIVALIGLASGCAERGDGFVAPKATGPGGQVDDLARALATGMAQSAVRDAIRDAMRASPWTEHKLSLQELVATSRGKQVLRAAARASGMHDNELETTIEGLPDLDFYVPARQHRLTWRAAEDYLVAVSLNGQAPRFGYDATGRRVPLDLTQPEPPVQTVFMLQTAEPKTRRIGSQPSLSGETIQDLEDGELGGALVLTDATGLTKTIELADLGQNGPLAQCYDNCTGGGGGGESPETFLTYIETRGIVDNNNPFESNEFEFSATAWDGSTGFLRITGVGSRTTVFLRDHLIYAIPVNETSRINIAVKETDGFLNPDDHFYYAADYYCGPVPFGFIERGYYWDLTEDSCSVAVSPNLRVQFTWF